MDGTQQIGSIGLPLPSTDIKFITDDGKEAGIDEPGELLAKGPQVMRGYWQRPDETSNNLTKDGWLKTGDIAQISTNGFIKIVDRKKDMILVSGFNVFPNEVEEVITQIPGILEVGVIGIKDEKSGEAVKACIVLKDKSLQKETIIAHCREHMVNYKVPKYIDFLETLPKTNIGKILRRKLK